MKELFISGQTWCGFSCPRNPFIQFHAWGFFFSTFDEDPDSFVTPEGLTASLTTTVQGSAYYMKNTNAATPTEAGKFSTSPEPTMSSMRPSFSPGGFTLEPYDEFNNTTFSDDLTLLILNSLLFPYNVILSDSGSPIDHNLKYYCVPTFVSDPCSINNGRCTYRGCLLVWKPIAYTLYRRRLSSLSFVQII